MNDMTVQANLLEIRSSITAIIFVKDNISTI